MTNRINVLDSITANQIAAGEVVERPASVVKELVENSIDAGAGRIEIEVNRAGMDLIRVTDGGCGMSKDDAVLAFQRHATSKLRTPSDLAAISSLGFRGEALPSIASVSRVELLTREQDVLVGTKVLVAGGHLDAVEEVGCPVGTTVIVRNIFFNTPARRKFLKSEGTELGQIADVINRIVLGCPQIAFKFVSQGRTLLQTQGSGNLLECFDQVYGKELGRDLVRVTGRTGEIVLEGYVGRPHTARASRSCQSFFINGRYIKSKALTRAVAEGFHTMLPGNRYPVVVLNLTLPVNTVDVNVHPTKLEVRFQQESVLSALIAGAVKAALTGARLIPGLQLIPPGPQAPDRDIIPAGAAYPAKEQQEKPEPEAANVEERTEQLELPMRPVPQYIKVDPSSEHGSSRVVGGAFIRETGAGKTSTWNEYGDFADPTQVMPSVKVDVERRVEELGQAEYKLPDLVPLGQVDSTFIIAKGTEGLYILDQHATHERINYERLWDRAEGSYGETQLLLEPLTLELTNQELPLLLENIVLFTDLGFLLEFFGGSTFLLRGKPADLGDSDPRGLLRDLLELFREGPKQLDPRKLREEFIYMLACKSSVRAHEVLSREELEQLVLQLGRTKNPYTCPHGRPTIIAITLAELAKRFQRV